MNTAYLIGNLFGAVIGSALGALVGGLLLMWLVKVVAKFRPPYREAYLAAFVGGVVTYLIGFVYGFIVGRAGTEISAAGYVVLTVLGFLVYAALVGQMIEHPETGRIGFGKACLVSLLAVLVVAGVAGALAFMIAFVIR